MSEKPDVEGTAEQRRGSARFARLPERVPPEEMTAAHPSHPPADPTMGRDTELDFMLRYAAL